MKLALLAVLLLAACQSEPLVHAPDAIRIDTNGQPEYVVDTVRTAAQLYPGSFLLVERGGVVELTTSIYPNLCEYMPGDELDRLGFINDPEFDDVVSECAVRYLGGIREKWE